jgi:DNA-directed RNA polymerase specialized sigma24 family protein
MWWRFVKEAIHIGTIKRDLHEKERQFDGTYRLNTAAGVKQLLGDYHAFQARQYLGDYEAVVVLADLAEAVRLAQLTERQRQAVELVYGADLTQKAAGERMGGLAKNTVSELVDRACEAVADVYYYWASHGEGYTINDITFEGETE